MRPSPTRRLAALLACALVGVAGCGPNAGASMTPSTAARTFAPTPTAAGPAAQLVWPAPGDPMGLTVAAGLEPESQEHIDYHVHAHLDIFIDGVRVIVPPGIGINTEDPEVKAFSEPDGSTTYGGIQLCAAPCISPLHTHAQTGIVHTESQNSTPNTLGQFFIEWGVELSATCVGDYCSPETPIAIYLNGDPFTTDPTDIVLADLLEIAIVIGTPPAVIPTTSDFNRD